MLNWILCENEHARLPDAWELSKAANEVGSCFACGAAARLQPIPAEEQREVLSGNDVPGHYILRPLAWARGAGVYQARQAKSRRLVALKVSRLGPDAGNPDTHKLVGIQRNPDTHKLHKLVGIQEQKGNPDTHKLVGIQEQKE